MLKPKAVILRKEKRQDGTVNVKVRISHNRMVRYIKTDNYVLPKYFDESEGKILPGG